MCRGQTVRGWLCQEGRAQSRHWPSLRRELKAGRTGSLSKAEGLARKQWVLEGVRCSSGHLQGLRTMLGLGGPRGL